MPAWLPGAVLPVVAPFLAISDASMTPSWLMSWALNFADAKAEISDSLTTPSPFTSMRADAAAPCLLDVEPVVVVPLDVPEPVIGGWALVAGVCGLAGAWAR